MLRCSVKNEPSHPGGVLFSIFLNFFPKNPSPSEWSNKIFVWKFLEWIFILINQLRLQIFIMELNSENLIVQHDTGYAFPN